MPPDNVDDDRGTGGVFRRGHIQYEEVVGGRMPGEAFVARLRDVLDRRADVPTPPTLVKVTGIARRTLKGHTGPVHAVGWSPDSRLATASSDHTARIWLSGRRADLGANGLLQRPFGAKVYNMDVN